MRKIFTNLLILAFLASPAAAKSIKVSSLQPFGTENPSETLKVMALETVEFKNGITFHDGAIIKGKMLKTLKEQNAMPLLNFSL